MCKRIFATSVVLTVAALAVPGPATAQSFAYSRTGARPTQTTQGYSGPASPPSGSQFDYGNPQAYGTGYSYSGSPYEFTSSGYVVDNLVNQQAAILEQKAYQTKLITRRQLFDLRRYEQMMTPGYEETRQASLATQYSQARNSPPLPQVWSGDAPNTLLHLIRETEAATGVRGPTVPLPADLCRHISFSSGTRTTVSASMVADGGSKLRWPPALARDEFTDDRKAVERAIDEAVRDTQLRSPHAGKAIEEARNEIANLREALRANVRKLSSQPYVDAAGYLRSLAEAVDALAEPSSAKLLAAPIEAATVAGLVDQMSQRGVRITAAAKGNESYYNALYSALSAYDLALTRMTGGFRPPPEPKGNRFE